MQHARGVLIQLARETRGLTQAALAKRTQIIQANISKWEREELEPSNNALSKVGRALDYPVEFFSRTDIEPLGLGVSGVFNRKRKRITRQDEKRISAEFSVRVGDVRRLLDTVEIQNSYRFRRYAIEDYDEPKTIAHIVRTQWNLPAGPIRNLIEVIENAGGIVFKYDMGTRKIDAQSNWVGGLPPVFFVNSGIPADRMRFTLAHEIGHVVMHEYPTAECEREADSFASALLMPAEYIIDDLNPFSLERAVELKRKWKVSIAAPVMRAFDLGVITSSQKRRYFTQLGVYGYRRREPVDLPDEKPTLFEKLVSACKESLGYGVRDLARLLCIYETDFQTRYLGMPPIRLFRFGP